jgi:hypothetical protein
MELALVLGQLPGVTIERERPEANSHGGPSIKPEEIPDGPETVVQLVDILLRMYKSTKTVMVLFALAPILAGCERGLRTLPTAPAVAASPAPAVAALPTPAVAASPALPSQRWNLTRTLKSVSTPDGCSQFGENTERSSDWLMAIQRSGESIRVLISDTGNFSDPWSYDGAVVAEAFSVTGPGFTGFLVCGETHFPYMRRTPLPGTSRQMAAR